MAKFDFGRQLSVEHLKAKLSAVDRKSLIQNAAMGAALFIFIFFFFLPLLMQNKKMADKLNNLKWKIGQSKVKIERIPELTKQKELFGARTEQVRKQFFDAKEADQLIGIISSMAADSGVKINASRPTEKTLELPPPFAQMYVAQSYELIVEGGYHNLGMFINKLEHYSKNFAVHSIHIASGQKGSSAQQCTLTLTAYMRRIGML